MLNLLRVVASFAAAIAGAASPTAKAAASSTTYEVSVGRDGLANVSLCVHPQHGRLQFTVDTAGSRKIVNYVRRTSGAALQGERSHWTADDWRADDCLAYVADIGSLSQAYSDAGSRYGEVLVTDPSYWLVRPDTPDASGSEITVRVPDGWSFSAPWKRMSQAEGVSRFHIPATPSTWSGSVLIGPMTERSVDVAGGTLWVDIVGAAPDDGAQQKLVRWIRTAAESVAGVSGGLPVPEARILIVPVEELSIAFRFAAWLQPAAVLGGESARGGGNSVEFDIDPRRPGAEFAQDWTAFHELSHLMHPYLGDDGSWLSEGLATYYQTVLRARAGVIAPDEAWRRLGSGFAEVAGAKQGETLETVAASMQKTGRFLYVYRSGAFFWMTVDVDLRRASAGKVTLDSAMRAFRECCLPSDREWKPEAFIAKLDRLLKVHTFSQRFAEFRQMKRFGDWQALYRKLGIQFENEKVSIDSSARDVAIREAIMAPGRSSKRELSDTSRQVP